MKFVFGQGFHGRLTFLFSLQFHPYSSLAFEQNTRDLRICQDVQVAWFLYQIG